MWKACGYLCLLAVTTVTASPWPNGWGSGGGGAASVPAQTYNPAASAASNNDYWWMSANPFQKPANHPGVEKTAVNSVGQSYQQASSPASQYVKPVSAPQPSGGCSGGCSNSFTAPQVQPPISQPSYGGAPAPSGGGWNGPQPAFAPANVPPPAFANPPPRPSVNFECMLTNKADCHSGAPAPQINQIAPQQNFAPQQSYAPPPNTVQLPSYSQPAKPEKLISPAPSGYSPKPVPAPQVSYQQPAPALQSGYQQPAPAPQVSYQQPAPAPQVSYQQPAPAPKPSYQQPAPAPQSGYQQPAPAPQSGYQQPAPAPAPAPIPNQIPQGYPKPQKPAEPAPSVSIAAAGWGAPMPPRYQPAPQPAPGYQPAPQPAPGYQPAPQPAPAPAQHQHMNAGDWKGDPGPHPPYPGCAAALLCVPDNECDAKGVVVPPTTLTDAERTYRVALTACTNPMSGIIGVCCRDPNYKDPWPDMNGGGGQQHHHHEGGQAAQQQNPYSDLVEPSPSSIQGQVALLQCQSNSLCVESDRCESTGQVLPTTRRCQEDSKNGTVYICCQVGQVESSSGGHGHSFSRPNYSQQQNQQNFHITDQVASQVAENEVQPERISIESNNEVNESKDFQSEQVSDSVGVPPVNSGPTDTLPSTVDSGDNITRNQQRLIYESSNSFIENSSQNPVAAPSIRVSLPNLPQLVDKSQLEPEPEDIKLVINQTRSTQRSQPVPTETVSTIVEANRPNVIDPRTIPTARQVPLNGRKTKQRIRIKLVSRIGDQPNVVNLPNGAQFNNNLRFSPVQSVVAANVAKNDEEVETSDDTVAATVNDGSQTVITRPRQRVIITDLRLPKQPDPTTETPRVSPASSTTSQPSYQEYKGSSESSQNSTSIFQEAPLVFEIHQGPNGVITEDSHGSIVEQNNQKSDGVFDQRNPKSDGVFGQRNPKSDGVFGQRNPQSDGVPDQRNPKSDRVVNQRNPTNAPEKNPTNAPEKNPTPAEAPVTVDIVANERKDQFHLYPFLPIGGDRQRESIVNEFGETIYVPSQTYQLPAISPEDQLRYITPPLFGDSEPEDGAEGDGSVTFFSALAQTSTDYTDECPENMKCLSEDYCSSQNPAEGDSKDFDIRLQSKKHSSSRQKCRQPHLPTDGYCCYLRDDYESVPNGESGISMNQSKAGRANNTISCGIRRPSEGESDKETSFGEFPWQALIFLNGRPSCGGVVLSERIVATSASCINVVRLQEVTIRVGEWDLRTLDEVKGHQDLSAQEFIPYPGYKPGLASDDYALLITKSRINLDYHVSPICLPNPIDRFDGQKCFSTAWSVPSSSSALEFGSRLNKASFAVIGNTECRLWKSSSGSSLPRNTFCVDPQASCLGDHGGPLVCENPSTGSYTLAGILTSKPTCPNTQGPNVYTNIASYAEWTYNILQRQFPEAVETSADIKF